MRGSVSLVLVYYGSARPPTPPHTGSFAVWGVLFSVFDCSLAAVRRVEDPWNPILAGAATGGMLAARAGVKAIARNAIAGGVILALIEGLQIVLMKQMSKVQLAQMKAQAEAMGQEFKLPDEDTLEPPVPPPTWTSAGTLASAASEDTFDSALAVSDGELR